MGALYFVGLMKARLGRIARAYEWFLSPPVPLVLAALWLAAAALMGVGALSLYLLWSALKGVATGG